MALVGMLVSSLSLLPFVSPHDPIPWPLIVGSTVYVLGAFCLAFNARGDSGEKAMVRLRFVRMGIIVIVFALLQKMSSH